MFMKRINKHVATLLLSAVFIAPTLNISSAMELNSSDSGLVSFNLASKDANMSEVMTYDEMVEEISKDNNISRDEAINILGPEPLVSYDEAVKDIAENKNISINAAKKLIDPKSIKQTKSGAQVRASYRTFTQYITVSSAYKPQLKWYCETSEGGGYCGIKKIKNTSLNRNYRGNVRQFKGSIYTNLEDSNTIFYRVNGDFTTGGNTSVTGGGEIALKKGVTLNFSITGNPGTSIYVHKDGRYRVHG